MEAIRTWIRIRRGSWLRSWSQSVTQLTSLSSIDFHCIMKHWRITIWAFPNPRRPCLDCKLNTDWCMAAVACNYIQLWRYIYVEIFAIVWNILRTAGGPGPSLTGDGCNWISWITHLTDDHSTPNHSRYEGGQGLRSVRTSVFCLVTNTLHIQLSGVCSHLCTWPELFLSATAAAHYSSVVTLSPLKC